MKIRRDNLDIKIYYLVEVSFKYDEEYLLKQFKLDVINLSYAN